jgi:hypothetical protein
MPAWTEIWLDTESDGFHGRLLSVTLVTQSGASFYGVLPPIHVTDPWAIKHVLPVLGAPTHMDDVALATDMAAWLSGFDGAEIIADWHRDLVHFFWLLGPRPGQQLRTCALRATLKPWLNGLDVDGRHGPLHNAKADALRMMEADLSMSRDRG